jgi:hypothetical protein
MLQRVHSIDAIEREAKRLKKVVERRPHLVIVVT